MHTHADTHTRTRTRTHTHTLAFYVKKENFSKRSEIHDVNVSMVFVFMRELFVLKLVTFDVSRIRLLNFPWLKFHILIDNCVSLANGDSVIIIIIIMNYIFFFHFSAKCTWSWPRGLSRGFRATACWDCEFESRRGQGCLSLLNVVYVFR